MADPFSILAASAGLLDVLVRAGGYLAEVHDAAGKIEDDIAFLSRDIQALTALNRSIGNLWQLHKNAVTGVYSANADLISETWRNVGAILRRCEATVLELSVLLQGVIGKDGSKVTGKLDGLRKVLRRQSKDGDFQRLRRQLAEYQDVLQLFLQTINLSYTLGSQESADHLSEKVDNLRHQIQAQMTSLSPSFNSPDGSGDVLRESIENAAAVASSMSLNRHFHIPQAVSSIFTGRSTLLDELKKALIASSPAECNQIQKRFVLYGLGGSGKTQFCCKFAKDNRKDFWGVFWIDASSHESAKHHFARIAKVGEVEPNVASVKNWLSSQERPWLLLIDNADDPEMAVEEYFPEGERGVILVTTRNPSNKVHGTIGSRYYHFEKLGNDEANDLLLAAACEPSPYKVSSRESAALIAKELGCLPLALVHAGKAIRHHLCSLANYLNFYKRHWQKLRLAQIEDNRTNPYSTFEVNYQPFEEKTTEGARDAVELLKMFSFFNCENIRVDFLVYAVSNTRLEQEQEKSDKSNVTTVARAKSWATFFKEMGIGMMDAYLTYKSRPVLPGVLRDYGVELSSEDRQDRLNAALDLLSQMSLITFNETTESYFMHPLVHTWARERPGMSTGEQAIWCQAAITTLAKCILLPPLGSTTSDEALRRDIVPHLDHVQHCQAEIRRRMTLNQSKRKKPWPVLTPKMDRQQAIVLAKFSRVYYQCGRYSEAELLQLEVRNYICPRLGMGNPKAQAITLALSGTLAQLTRFEKAAELQHEVVQARLGSLGPDHPDTLKAMDILGANYCHQGLWSDAEGLHRAAVEGMMRVLGPEHRDYLIAVDNLGKLMMRYFRFEESRELHLKALTGMKKAFGPNHLQTLECMENLSMASTEIGGEHLKSALEMIDEVFQERQKILGKESPWTLVAVLSRSRVLLALDQTAEAEKALRANIPIGERTIGANHFGVLAAKQILARVLTRQERYDEAETIFTDVIEVHNRALGVEQHRHTPDQMTAMYYLMECYRQQGKNDDALRICDELTEILEGRKSTHKFYGWVKKARENLQGAGSASVAESPVTDHLVDVGQAVPRRSTT